MTEVIVTLFSIVVWLAKGHYDPTIVLLTLCFLTWVYFVIFKPKRIGSAEKAFRYFPFFAACLMLINSNLNSVDESMKPLYPYFKMIPLLFSLLVFKLENRKWPYGLFLVFYFLVLFFSPNPFIDVFRSNTEGVKFLLNGLNPYSQVYPDIYGGEFHYQSGFLYWPGALYLQTLSQFVFKDVRAILILSWWGSLFFIPLKQRLSWCMLPFIAFGFEQGWLDPVLSFCAAGSLWAIQKRKFCFLALLIATAASIKQYGFLIGLMAMLWIYFKENKNIFFLTLGKAALLFMILLAPFLIWNAQDFFSMTIASHALAASREDSLNFTAFWMKTSKALFPGWAQALMTLLGFTSAIVHVIKNREGRGIGVIAEAWAIAFGFSILFGKFAFCNYHWLLISFWLLSLAWTRETADECKV